MCENKIVFAGKTSRVMAQLYTYNISEMAEKTGLDIDIFNVDLGNNSLKEQDRNIQIFEVSYIRYRKNLHKFNH